jgi:Ca2+-binding RTX toxin-like protein
MPRTLLPLALAAATLAMTATEADAAVVPDIQDRVLTVTGDDAAELITLRIPAASPTSLEIDLGDGTADFRIPRTRFDAVRVVAGGGDDRVRIDDGGTRFPLTVPTTVLGGAGNDALTGGRGAETLLAGDGADKVAGGGGADVVDLGAGDDRYDWRAADGNDDVDGGSGSDLVLADGTDADDRLTLSAAGARARIAGDTTALGTAGVEHVDVNARSGSDVITIGDLTGTAVQQVEPNLSLGLTDAGADRVVLAGTPGNDVVNVFPNGLGSALVVGTHAVVRVRHADPVRDALAVQGGAGRDDLSGGGGDLPMALVLDGGDGDDQLSGTAAADTLLGGAGNDFADGQRGDDDVRLGDGNDVYAVDAGDGADAVRGDAGTDRISLSGSSAKEQFEVAAAGQGARIAVGATAIETPGGVERVDLLSFGGSDRVAVRDLTGTGVTDVTASLFDFGVPGGAFDEVTVDGTAGDDVVTAAAGPVVLTGLPAKVTVTGTAAGDRLVIDGKDGKDTIDSTALPAGGIAVHGFGSAGDDVLLGGDGDDVLGGGDGSDVIFAGSGDNVALGGAGDDVLRGEEGDDVLDGGAGDDILIGGAGDDVLLNGEVVFDD